jgi:acyl-CoA reductase-like NAD-dependent aldehyde dehydrogenase
VLELGLLDTLDVGKPVMDMVFGEVPAASLTFHYCSETIDKVEGAVATTASDVFHCTLRQPLDVMGCITPRNYPLLMSAWTVAVGNYVVLKPTHLSPLSPTLLANCSLRPAAQPVIQCGARSR